ncbi:dUTP diphosphatase [Chlamydiales bacterium]|nr:dUTP diphosphatase [Chlamydiales bacterium]
MDEDNHILIPTLAENESDLPTYASKEAAGADLKADINSPIVIKPGDTALIPTGIRVAIPIGYEIQIRPRSGLALKHGVTVLNSPGTIDADYRGDIGVILINHGKQDFTVTSGMRIAQAVIAQVIIGKFLRFEELAETVRGTKGFGHSGTH